ncbi:MAG: recombinase RecJ [Hungatella sp.]|nr:recombinase RecJ [Hungatella sp.]
MYMNLRLGDLLQYDDIAIQCHDNPDADAIASGYGIYTYLKEHGKNPRLLYGGKQVIQKSNLVLLKDKFDIPIEHVETLEEPELLLTIDCQYGQGNVQKFGGKNLAVIDHHQISCPEALPSLCKIHSNYGACSTIVWYMLTEAGYDVNQNRKLATALYYGLYMDTNRLQEISHPMDKDMRDELKIDKSAVIHFQNTNLSLEELRIASEALASYDYSEKQKFALVKSEPCDPNILGIISDMLIEVDVVNTCIAFCMLGDNVKMSVRSCVKEARADDLASFVSREIGSAGGHVMKAGGFLDGARLKKVYEKELGALGSVRTIDAAHRILRSRLETYFGEEEIIDTDCYRLTLSDMKIYQKNPISVGYARAEDIFPAGTEILVRMLEGDVEITVEAGLCIMIGIDHEIYPSRLENVKKNYETSEEPYDFRGEYQPTVRNTVTGENRPLIPYAKTCISRDISKVYARRLDRRTKLFTQWDKEKYMLGEKEDYLVARKDDPRDLYIVKKDIFSRIYTLCQEEQES